MVTVFIVLRRSRAFWHRRTRILASLWFLDKPSDKVERQAPQASSGELLFVAKTDDESLKLFSLLREELL